MRNQAQTLFLILSGIFIAALVSCNLIFQKFFTWSPFGLYTFEISVGIIPYPITFLVTDIISEIYGRKRANKVVLAGLISSVFVLGVVLVANASEATEWSPVSNSTFSNVFGLTGVAVGASMIAYLLAQFIDIRVFHFWKRLTKGKYLWLRNNASTFTSQFMDTATILCLLCLSGGIPWEKFWILLFNGFLFKVIMALIDTPILYIMVGLIRKKFNLKLNEELEI
ncbi:MAG: queuosine precursor transporter [Bacteroidota bacterium]|nr:queuosine precursor transporter [Bacteroidota bacterium]